MGDYKVNLEALRQAFKEDHPTPGQRERPWETVQAVGKDPFVYIVRALPTGAAYDQTYDDPAAEFGFKTYGLTLLGMRALSAGNGGAELANGAVLVSFAQNQSNRTRVNVGQTVRWDRGADFCVVVNENDAQFLDVEFELLFHTDRFTSVDTFVKPGPQQVVGVLDDEGNPTPVEVHESDNDIPWLFQDTEDDTPGAGGNIASTPALAVGEYEALIQVSSNDPVSNRVFIGTAALTLAVNVGAMYPMVTVRIPRTALIAGDQIAVSAEAAGSAGAAYSAPIFYRKVA